MKLLKSLVVTALLGLASTASAATVQATDQQYMTNRWAGSAQGVTAIGEGLLNDISFVFDAESAGKSFQFSISTALSGGTTLFTQAVTIVAGLNTVTTNLQLQPGTAVFAIWDFQGLSGKTTAFGGNTYDSGISAFFSYGRWSEFRDYDLTFTARFDVAPSVPPAPVPVPAAGLLLLGALGGLTLLRRKA